MHDLNGHKDASKCGLTSTTINAAREIFSVGDACLVNRCRVFAAMGSPTPTAGMTQVTTGRNALKFV
jgi:hypothetical protein